MKSLFLSNLHYFCAQTDGTYKFPDSAEGDLLKQAKKEIEALEAENVELRAKVIKFDDPVCLHAHCVRYLTDAQVAHLFGERMTEIQNSRDKLEAENAALREYKKKASERLRYLARFWNPNFVFESDEIGKYIVAGDYDQMIKTIDQRIKDINAARKEAQP